MYPPQLPSTPLTPPLFALCHFALIILTSIHLTFPCHHFPPPFLSLDAFPLPTPSYLPSSSTPALSLTDLLTLPLHPFYSRSAFPLLLFLPHSLNSSSTSLALPPPQISPSPSPHSSLLSCFLTFPPTSSD